MRSCKMIRTRQIDNCTVDEKKRKKETEMNQKKLYM